MANKRGDVFRRYVLPALVVLTRIVVGATFIFSGFVKAVDPIGVSLKIQEYILAFGADYFLSFSLFAAIFLGAYEFALGVGLIFGSYRKTTSGFLLLTMLVLTPVTLYLALTNPISDCGCFGEAVYLTNWQTFSKNVVLLLLAFFLLFFNGRVKGVYHKEIQSLVVYFSLLFSVAVSLFSYYYQPIFDFRPYKVGVSIREALTRDVSDDQRFV